MTRSWVGSISCARWCSERLPSPSGSWFRLLPDRRSPSSPRTPSNACAPRSRIARRSASVTGWAKASAPARDRRAGACACWRSRRSAASPPSCWRRTTRRRSRVGWPSIASRAAPKPARGSLTTCAPDTSSSRCATTRSPATTGKSVRRSPRRCASRSTLRCLTTRTSSRSARTRASLACWSSGWSRRGRRSPSRCARAAAPQLRPPVRRGLSLRGPAPLGSGGGPRRGQEAPVRGQAHHSAVHGPEALPRWLR